MVSTPLDSSRGRRSDAAKVGRNGPAKELGRRRRRSDAAKIGRNAAKELRPRRRHSDATKVGRNGRRPQAAAFHVTAEDESPDAWSASGVAALAVRQGVRAIGVVLGLLSAASTEVDVCAACAAVEDGVVHVVLVHADDVVATVSGATITCADAATGAPAPCLLPASGACRAISAWETGCGHGRLLAGDADQVPP